jgi:hypothetical protein
VTTSPDNQRLVEFLGYGPTSPAAARLVFFGQEESCPRSTIEINLLERRKESFPRDKDDACKILAEACGRAGHPDAAKKYLAAREPGVVPQWNLAARFANHFFGSESWESEYRALGKPDGRTFLAERFPLLRPAWDAHKFENESTLTKAHLAVLQRDLIAPLDPGTVIVSYAGRATELVGPMVPLGGNRKWTAIATSERGGKPAEIARSERYPLVVLSVLKPKKGDEELWELWLGEAVEHVMKQVEVVRNAKR